MVLCGCALVPDYLHVHQEAKVEFSILCHFNNWIIPARYYHNKNLILAVFQFYSWGDIVFFSHIRVLSDTVRSISYIYVRT